MRPLACPGMCWWWWLFLMPGWPARQPGWLGCSVDLEALLRCAGGPAPELCSPMCASDPVLCCTIFSCIGHLTSGHQHPCPVKVMWEQEKEPGCVQASSGPCLHWRALYFQELVFFLVTKTNAGLCRWSRRGDPSANAGDTGLILGPGRFHMLRSN